MLLKDSINYIQTFLFSSGTLDDDDNNEGASCSTSVINVLDQLFQGAVPQKMMEDTREILAPKINMEKAREHAEKMRAVHAELNTLPRCAKHGTVSFCLFFVYCMFFVSSSKAVSFLCCSIFDLTLSIGSVRG